MNIPEWIVWLCAYGALIIGCGFAWAHLAEKNIEEFPEPDDAQPSGFDQK